MADGIVQLQPDSTGKKVDTSEITVGANTVERQRIVIADNTTAASLAFVGSPSSDAESGDISLATEAHLKAWNGSSWDRVRLTGSLGGVTVGPGPGPTATTGSITTASTVVGPVTMNGNNGCTVAVSGTYAGVNFTFEGSNDNSVWYTLQGIRTDSGLAESSSGVLTANTTRAWDISVSETQFFRVRATAWTSGSAAINIVIGGFAADPVLGAIAQGVAASGSAVLGNPVLIGGSDATNARTLLTDTSGRLAVSGAAASGSVLAGNPVLVAGSDGTNARNITVDASGRVTVVGVTGTSSVFVQGAAASAATIAGNPVLAGWTFTTTQPTVTTGQAVNAQSTNRGELLVSLSNGATAVAVKAASTAAAFTDPALTVDPRPGGALVTASAALADATANPTLGRGATHQLVYNGSTWDLARGMSGNLTTGDTGAKTATGNGATITNVGNKGVQVLLNLGAVTGTTPTLVLKLQGSVDGGTNWYDIPGATTASLTASGVYGITVYPGIAVTAGTATTATTAGASYVMPRTWRTVWTIGGTTPSFTITNIQYNYLNN